MAARVRRTRIVIFAKAPVAGKAKTRLIPALGAKGAAELARVMLERTVNEAVATGLAVELCATPAPSDAEWKPFLPEMEATDQGEGDLGERLARAAARTIEAGENILLIGTDCPELNRERLKSAAEAMSDCDALLHPARDGGYVLLGLRRFHPGIFSGIKWSTASVAAETIACIKALGWSMHIDETLRDIDEPEDLAHLPSFPRKRESSSSSPPAFEEAGFPLSRE
jgi:rSAM/selenodomain-associated transferase 1